MERTPPARRKRMHIAAQGGVVRVPDRSREGSQTERAAFGIRDMVLRGRFKAGERLTELSLVDVLQVSRTPVRAALQRLAQEGLLEPARPSGYVVRGFTESEIADAIEVRGALEGLAAAMAAERGVPRPLLGEMRDCLGQIDATFAQTPPGERWLSCYSVCNARFHELMLEAAGSDVVARALQGARSLPYASHDSFVAVWAQIPGCLDILRMSQLQHHQILEAIEARSSARVEPLVREHARMARRNLELVLRDPSAFQQLPGAPLIRRRSAA